MSIVSRAAKTVTWTFDPTVNPENDIIREHVLLEGGGIFTGSTVTVDKAYGFVPVMAAIRLRSETIASLPLPVYQRIEGGKRAAPDHRLYSLLHDKANPEMSAMVFKELLQSHADSWGTGFAEIELDTDGFPLWLWPLRADNMQTFRDNGKIIHLYTLPDGTQARLRGEQVFRIPGLGSNGITGYSPIHMARQAIALGQAAEEMAGRFYANDARPGLAIKLGPEYDYDDDAKKRLAESFDATHAGLRNKHRTAILDEGMDLQEFGFPADDAQLVEQQKWSVEQVCRIFNIPPHMLHSLERATFNNIEELGLNFVTYSLRPWLVRWEQQIKMQLLANDTRHFAEFNVEGLLRGKIADRMDAYWKRFQMGSLSPNEIRSKENENPIENGDNYYVPVNIGEIPDEEEEPETPTGQLPPLRLVGARSAKALAPADQRRALAEEFRPLFEKVTGAIVEFEAKQVLAEAERRFGTPSESTKAIEALTDTVSTLAHRNEPDSAPVWLNVNFDGEKAKDMMRESVSGTVLKYVSPIAERQADQQRTLEASVAASRQFMERQAKAIAALQAEVTRPRNRTIKRDENGRIVGLVEE